MDLGNLITSIAPTVASALLGPMGGVAVAALGKIFGLDNATTESVTKALQDGKLTPDQLTQIKALELQYQNEEKERGFKYSELEFQDTEGARHMQELTNSNIPPTLAILVTMGFFGILAFMLMNAEYKPTEPLLVMLGSLGTAWTMVIGFYFGSSHGSRENQAALRTMVESGK